MCLFAFFCEVHHTPPPTLFCFVGPQGIKAELELDDSALESYYANAKFQSDCGDYVTAAASLKSYCDITQTPGVPGSGPNGMSALWGRLACEVGVFLWGRGVGTGSRVCTAVRDCDFFVLLVRCVDLFHKVAMFF